MSHGRVIFATESQLEKDNNHKPLVITNCGYYIENNHHSFFEMPPKEGEWLLLYLHKGQIKLSNHKKIIQNGCVLIFPPSTFIPYHFLDDDINERYYVYFKGTYALSYMKQFLLDSPIGIYNIGTSKTLVSYFEDIMNDFKIHDFNSDVFRSTYLLRLLNHIHKKLPAIIQQSDELSPFYLLIEYMEKNYWKQLTLKDFTTFSNMSTPAFMRNFKKYFNTTPHAYLNNIRLTQAQHLLASTNLPIADIAIQVGFLDPLYFCKFFKKETNLSPTAYRKTFIPKKYI